jgi:hypothetical protein
MLKSTLKISLISFALAAVGFPLSAAALIALTLISFWTMSYSFHNAGRATHFKILTVALACSVAVTLDCLTAHSNDQTSLKIARVAVIKAKPGILMTSDDAKATR